jgi:ArsR family transcriptional regulator, virulence genes transcriptional regulator
MENTKIDGSALRQNTEQASNLLKILANPHRLMILCTLIDGELSVGELNDCIDVSQSTLSQHLAILRSSGLVATRRQAQTIYYSVRSREVQALIGCLHSIYCE